MSNYGISVGVLKYGKPYLGAIYVPATKEVVYFDGKKAHWLQNAFRENQQKSEIAKRDANPTAFSASSDILVIANKKYNSEHIDLGLYSSIVHFLYLATNRLRGHYCAAYPWDIAGAWATFKHLGIEAINIETGEVLEEISDKTFSQNWKLKVPHVFCRPSDFEHYQSLALKAA